MPVGKGKFVWYELMTSDLEAAQRFYAAVVGWSMVDAAVPGIRYILAKLGEKQVAGLMPLDQDGAPCMWFGYILVDDVDGMAERVRKADGAVLRPPANIPGVGRFAVVADPQGAMFMLFKRDGEPAPDLAPNTPGTVGWHELHTTDWGNAFAFYQELFDWEKSYAHDMGAMGVYQTFSVSGAWTGGMMNSTPASSAQWSYYINVDDINAAAARVVDNGGSLTHGPLEVPGGNWILMGTDPQGARFALTCAPKG